MPENKLIEDAFKEGLTGSLDAITDLVPGGDAARDAVGNIIDSAGETDTGEKIIDAVEDVVNTISDFVKKLVSQYMNETEAAKTHADASYAFAMPHKNGDYLLELAFYQLILSQQLMQNNMMNQAMQNMGPTNRTVGGELTDEAREYIKDVEVTWIGDSLGVGTAPYANELMPKSVQNNRASRQITYEGDRQLDATRTLEMMLEREEKVHDIVVFIIGTNRGVEASEVDAVVNLVGPSRKILFVDTASEVEHAGQVASEYAAVSQRNENAFHVNWATYVGSSTDSSEAETSGEGTEGTDSSPPGRNRAVRTTGTQRTSPASNRSSGGRENGSARRNSGGRSNGGATRGSGGRQSGGSRSGSPGGIIAMGGPTFDQGPIGLDSTDTTGSTGIGSSNSSIGGIDSRIDEFYTLEGGKHIHMTAEGYKKHAEYIGQAIYDVSTKDYSDPVMQQMTPGMGMGMGTGMGMGSFNGTGSALAQALVAECAKYEGAPYSQAVRYGPSYDCSSLMQTIFKDVAGVDIGSNTWEQEKYSGGQFLSPEMRQPADLIYYGTKGNPYHVSMCIDRDNIFHAATPALGTIYDKYANMAGSAYTILRINELL